MIFIGGISQGQKILDYVKTVICDRCGAYGRYQVMMTYMYFSFFFIPLFKWNKKFYVKCPAVKLSMSWIRKRERRWPGDSRRTSPRRT